MKSPTYIIGDVHGHYDTLLALVEKLPKEAELIFVGDLVDRGPKSVEVVRYIRENGYRCVLGNHEEMMVNATEYVISAYEEDKPLDLYADWFGNGGVKTLLSYGLIKLIDGKPHKVDDPVEAIKQIRDDIAWMRSLPLYIELEHLHPSGKPIVISHACVGNVWHFHDDMNNQYTFRDYALWNRKQPREDMPIFNIFGHTPVEFGVEIEEHYVNRHGYAMLSAYCVESGETVSVYCVK